MNRATALVVLASFVYALAWFLPVHHDGITLAQGGLPGWEALMVAFSPLGEIGTQNEWSLLPVLSGLTNVWFLVSVAALTLWPFLSPRRLGAGLLLATLVNGSWLTNSPEYLRAGYYLWLTAFPLLAVACWSSSRVPAKVTPRAA
jgi:hypothetical protein